MAGNADGWIGQENGKPDLSDAGEGASGAERLWAGRPLFRLTDVTEKRRWKGIEEEFKEGRRWRGGMGNGGK